MRFARNLDVCEPDGPPACLGLDMNDFGDIVVSAFDSGDTRIVLMTQRPEFYSAFGYQEFGAGPPVIPLPSAFYLFLSAISGIAAIGRKKIRQKK